jgi:hypothetical protein
MQNQIIRYAESDNADGVDERADLGVANVVIANLVIRRRPRCSLREEDESVDAFNARATSCVTRAEAMPSACSRPARTPSTSVGCVEREGDLLSEQQPGTRHRRAGDRDRLPLTAHRPTCALLLGQCPTPRGPRVRFSARSCTARGCSSEPHVDHLLAVAQSSVHLLPERIRRPSMTPSPSSGGGDPCGPGDRDRATTGRGAPSARRSRGPQSPHRRGRL